MFGLITSLAKAAVSAVALPVAAVVDVAEATGLVKDSGRVHTAEMVDAVIENIENAVDPRS